MANDWKKKSETKAAGLQLEEMANFAGKESKTDRDACLKQCNDLVGLLPDGDIKDVFGQLIVEWMKSANKFMDSVAPADNSYEFYSFYLRYYIIKNAILQALEKFQVVADKKN